MKTYIVTGGAGFIGSHVVRALLQQNVKVIVVDDLSSGFRTNLPEHPHLSLLIKNVLDCCPEDFPESVDGVVHLAAKPSVVESWDVPLDVHQQNLSSTVAIIELCQHLAIPRLVFASSAAIYGNQLNLPITEAAQAAPDSPYGLQKLASENYLSLFSRHSGFCSVSLRFFNVFGPRQAPGSPYSGVISILTDAMRENRDFTIHGDGDQTRDFIYVEDVARYVCEALQTPLPGSENTILNIGSGREISVNRLVEVIRNHFPAWTGNVRHVANRPGAIRASRADIANVEAILGGVPGCGFEEAIRYYIEHTE